MENEDQNMENQPNPGALSIYGQADAAMDDFPVLKAFQQYIDAEQSKSRKRMILLCMFFGVLMTILVAAFFLVLAQMNRDKQHANDQLIEFLMRERERTATASQQPVGAPTAQPSANPAQDAALKAVTETLVNLQKQMAEDKKAAADTPTRAQYERERKAERELEEKTARETEKLKRAKELLDAEKRRLAAEREKLRQEEIERQRRRLYPEYYARQEKGSEPPSRVQAPSREQSPSPKPIRKKIELSDADIDDILREVDEIKAEEEAETKSEKKSKKSESGTKMASKEKSKDKSKDKDKAKDKDDGPIEYFNDTEYSLPVKVGGEESNFTLSLE